MVKVVDNPVNQEKKYAMLDRKALDVFHRCLDMLGGPRKLFEYKRLTWLPSLMEAVYVIVLSQEYAKTAREIAAELGLSTQTVRNILNASANTVEAKIKAILEGEEVEKNKKTHIAGGLAKLAYDSLKKEEA